MADEDKDPMDTSWIKVGEHSSREALQAVALKIKAKWLGRYDFQICACPLPEGQKGFELQLRHR